MIPEEIQKCIDAFSALPSIGPRLATRLVFHLANSETGIITALAETLTRLQELDRCPYCFFLKQKSKPLCPICTDATRDARTIAIVEKETDLLSLERIRKFRGRYLILGDLPERGVLEPFQKLRIRTLQKRIKEEPGGKAQEIIVAVTPNTFGDFVYELIRQEFKELAEKVTRLGRGIPTGGEIEFADEETLGSALERRSEK